MSLKKDLLYRLSLALGPPLFKYLGGLLLLTCRFTWVGREDSLDRYNREKRPMISAFWHYGIFVILRMPTNRKWLAMVSASRDGEYVARIAECLGFEAVRGSRNRRGVGALKEMIRAVKERGGSPAIVADGSQGPPLVAQAGSVLLASYTGVPIIPVGWAADRYWSFRSWDRTALPKPFARIVVEFGEPFTVPSGLREEELEEYRLKLEHRLLEIYRRCWGRFGRQTH